MTPTRTVYVKKEDEVVWERAQELAGRSLSALISDLLADYVARLYYAEPKIKKVVARLEKKGIKESFARSLLQGELRMQLQVTTIRDLVAQVERIHQNPTERRLWGTNATFYTPEAFETTKAKGKSKG